MNPHSTLGAGGVCPNRVEELGGTGGQAEGSLVFV